MTYDQDKTAITEIQAANGRGYGAPAERWTLSTGTSCVPTPGGPDETNRSLLSRDAAPQPRKSLFRR